MILFLDFDGVLHHENVTVKPTTMLDLKEHESRFIRRDGQLVEGENLFEHADRLALALEPFPDVRIVITSTWRLHFDLDALQRFLPHALADRVIGITPKIFSWDGVCQRSREIDAYLQNNNRSDESWVALDDHEWRFSYRAGPQLILCNGEEGFTEAVAVVFCQRLRDFQEAPAASREESDNAN
jgi:hypothetical protein